MGLTTVISRDVVPELPPRSTPYPASLGILGEPIAKREYFMRRQNTEQFLAHFAGKVRSVVGNLATLDVTDIDARAAMIHTKLAPVRERALAAWEVLAWNVMFKPFSHPKRLYKFDPAPYLRAVEQDPEALFNYGVYIERKPSQETLKKLTLLHPEYARMYRTHMRNYAIALEKVPYVGPLFNW